MNKQQKALKSKLRAKCACPKCGEPATEMLRLEIKAIVAGKAQESIAKAILMDIEDALKPMHAARDFLKSFLKKP